MGVWVEFLYVRRKSEICRFRFVLYEIYMWLRICYGFLFLICDISVFKDFLMLYWNRLVKKLFVRVREVILIYKNYFVGLFIMSGLYY